jgi:FkbM family methyltransferase
MATGNGAMSLLAPRRLRPALKRLVERGASRLGYQVIPSWRLRSFEHARHMQHLFAQLQIDTVLDVGANEGGYREMLRDFVGFGGRIVSFEPVPSVFAKLQQAARDDSRWKGYQMALGDGDGELQINVTQRTTMSSFLTRDETRLRGLGYDHLLNVTDIVRTEPVPVRRLDSLFDDALDRRTDARVYLKCDTQGFDLKVIAGAAASLRSIMALQIELSFKPIYANAPAYSEVLEQMTAQGFDVTGIYPVRRDELFRIVNFDCVMINSRHPVVAALADKLVTGRVPSVA